jgi:hypothetical protein
MDKVVIRVRRRTALAGLLAGSVMLAVFGIGGVALIRARDASGALPPWWLQLLTVLVFGFFVVVAAVGARMAWRGLRGVPTATLDDGGVHLAGVGTVDWSDVRGVDIVHRRHGRASIRIELKRWERYAARFPAWERWLVRRMPRHEAVMLDLANTDTDPLAICALIRDEAVRHRRPAAELTAATVRRDV